MIVRQLNQSIPKHIVYSVAGGFILIVALVLSLRASMQTTDTPLCEARYPGGILFSLAKPSGVPLAAEDLEARLDGLDWGIRANTRIVADKGVPFGHALEIDMKSAPALSEHEQKRGGMGFTWLPQQLAASTAACLSYSVWASAEFKPGDGGVLPGLASNASGIDQVRTGEQQQFSSRPIWRPDGSLGVSQILNVGNRALAPLDPKQAALKPNRWVRIEQEVVLNVPGQANGTVRTWVDGKLLLERSNVGFRKQDAQSFQAVSGDIHYTKNNAWAPAPADAKLRLSPLELRLK